MENSSNMNLDEFVLKAYENDSSQRLLSPRRGSSRMKQNNLDSSSILNSPTRRYETSPNKKNLPNLENSSTSSDPPILPLVSDKMSALSSIDGSASANISVSSPNLNRYDTSSSLLSKKPSSTRIYNSSASVISTRSTRSSTQRSTRRRSKSRKKRGGRSRSRSKQKRSGSVSSERTARTTRSTRSTRSGRSWNIFEDDDDELELEDDIQMSIPDTIKYAGEDHGGSTSMSIAHSIRTGNSSRKSRDLEQGKHFIPIEFAPAGPGDDFRVIVLLLDPNTRKFEFIHCYFDNETSLVKDIVNLIPKNSTFGPLRRQVYLGLCRPTTGEEMINSFMAKEYDIRDNEILIAIPRGLTGEKCVYHSKAILKKEKLIHLIRKTDPRWKEQRKKAMMELSQKQASNDPFVQFLEHMTTLLVGKKRQRIRKRTIRTLFQLLFSCFILNTILNFTLHKHEQIRRPIQPGELILPGQRRNRCGLWALFPKSMTGCHSISLYRDQFTKDTLTLFDDYHQLVLWELKGRKSIAINSMEKIRVNDKGRVLIDNMPAKITFMTNNGRKHISPWPFEIIPKDMRKGWLQRLTT